MIMQQLPDEVLIIHPASVLDEYGNVTKDFNEDSEFDSCKGWIQADQGSSVESKSSERTLNTATFRIYLPAGTVLSANDQVQVSGISYTVEGAPTIARGLRGVSHIKANIKRIEG
jgi:hypothetical protein